MENTKKWWASKGIWGSLLTGGTSTVMFVQGVMTYVEAHPGEMGTLMTALTAAFHNGESALLMLGSFIAWYGRWKATSQISNDIK